MDGSNTTMKTWYEQYKDYYRNPHWHIGKNILNGACLFHWIVLLQPRSILEVGAGSGTACVVLKRLLPQAQIFATDIDERVCSSIQKLARSADVQIEVERQDALALTYAGQTFDVCFSCGLLEHFSQEDMTTCVSEQLRVSKYVLATVPLAHWFLSGLRAMGDELVWPKIMWLQLLSRQGNILDFTLHGGQGEEIGMTLVMTRQSAEFPFTPHFHITVEEVHHA